MDTTLIHVVCKEGVTGQIEIDITGGNAPYSVSWSKLGVFVDNTPIISGLTAGIYRLTVVDALSCPTLEKDVTIEWPTTAYAINPLGTAPLCFAAQDGVININVTEDIGHPTPYQLTWKKDGELLNASEDESDSGKIVRAFQLALNRDPEKMELQAAGKTVAKHGLATLCRVLFNSSEFLFLP